MSTKPVSIFTAPANLPTEAVRERKHMLARLAISWLIMMQTMMFAFPGYIHDTYSAVDEVQMLDHAVFFMNWLSLIVTVPVVMYCAWPIWKGVVGDREGASSMHVNMNWPIALGIVVAFIPSAVNTWMGAGDVYFESVCMFVAFLLTSRYMEFCAEQSARYVPNSVPTCLLEAKKQVGHTADKVAFAFVVIQIILSMVTAAIWLIFLNEKHLALSVMVALFVMSCPCAMSISVPTAFSAARAIILNNPDITNAQQNFVVSKAERCAKQNLYGSLTWHIAMTPLAMVGIVSPWLAALTMFVSTIAVASNSWRFYRHYNHTITTLPCVGVA